MPKFECDLETEAVILNMCGDSIPKFVRDVRDGGPRTDTYLQWLKARCELLRRLAHDHAS